MDNSIRRRKVLKTLSVTSVSATLAGCQTGDSDDGDGGDTTPIGTVGESEWPDLSGQTVHLLIDENSEPFRNLFNSLGAAFTQATGANVNNEFAGIGSSIEQRVAQLIQAGDPPEVLFSSGARATELANADALAPATEAVEYWEEQWGKLPENLRIQIDDEDWLLPVSSKGGVLWRRADIMEEEPEQWDDFLDICSNVDSSEGMRAHYLPRGQGYCGESLYHLGRLYSNGANVVGRKNGEVEIVLDDGNNMSRVAEVLEYYNELHEYSPVASDSGCGSIGQAVPAGQTLSTEYWVSRPKVGSVEQGFGDVVRGSFPPYGREENVAGNVEGFVTFDTENSDAAIEWLKFLSQIEYLMPLFEITPFQIQPIYPEITETDEWQSFTDSLDNWTQEDQEIARHRNYTIAPNETSPPNPYAGNLIAARQLSTMAFNVTIEGMSIDEAITSAADELRTVLSDAKGE